MKKLNTGGLSVEVFEKVLKDMFSDIEKINLTPVELKINSASNITKAAESLEELSQALKSYSEIANKNGNFSKTMYFTTEEKAINRLKNAWESYAEERNKDLINDDTLANSNSAKNVLRFANALEALTGNKDSISKVGTEISDLVNKMRAMPNFINYNLNVNQFTDIFSILKKIQELYPDVSEIIKPFKGAEQPVENLTTLINNANASTNNYSANTEEKFNIQDKAVESVERLNDLYAKKDEQSKKELLEAVERSTKSYEEIMRFLEDKE